MKFSSKVESCGLSPIRKFYPYQVAAEARGIKVLHLNIGQPDIPTPKEYFDAVSSFSQKVLAYAPSPGIPELIDAVKAYYGKMDIELETGDIIVTTGGSEALRFAIDCIIDQGDELLVPEPYYTNYATFTKMAGGKVVGIPAGPESSYRFADKEKIEALITDKTKAILFTNPGNPTGVALSEAECRLLADIAKEHDLFIIADEVYREFNYSGKPLVSMASFEDVKENVILIDSVSKRFSACGARIGAIISRNKELMQHVVKLAQARLSVATIDQVAAAAMYSIDPSFYAETAELYKQRRDAVCEELDKIPGAEYHVPEGAFYLMVKIPVDNTDEFQKWLLEDFSYNGETIMYAPGPGFYITPGKGLNEFRLAYCTAEEELRRAVKILGIAIEEYNKR